MNNKITTIKINGTVYGIDGDASSVVGTATSEYNTLGKVQSKIESEVQRATAAEDTKADKATTIAGYGITDVYTKSETYNKAEINDHIDTPNQGYITAIADNNTTTADIKTLIDTAAGTDKEKADFIYRVGSWDGTQYNETTYSEYAWIDTDYVFLSKKSQIDEVFDISAYHANATYTDLAAALGTNGDNVPSSLHKGGMSIKFVQSSVQSSDNKYVQYRLMSNTFNTTVTNWQGVDKEPTAGSDNLVKSGGVFGAIKPLDEAINGTSNSVDTTITFVGGVTISGINVYKTLIDIKAGTYKVNFTNTEFHPNYIYFNAGSSSIVSKALSQGLEFTLEQDCDSISFYGGTPSSDTTIKFDFVEQNPQQGLVGKVVSLEDEVSDLVDLPVRVTKIEDDIEDISEVVFGNDKSNSLSVNFAANVSIDVRGSRYPTSFTLKAGTYKLTTALPSALTNLFMYFYDVNGNPVKPTSNMGVAFDNLTIPPYDSVQPFTFSTDVASVNFFSSTPSPSADCTFTFSAEDVNKDKNVREAIDELSVVPDVVFPRKLYLLSTSGNTPVENSIYHKHYMSFQNPRFGIDINRGYGWRWSSRFLRVDAQGTIQNPTVKLYDIPNRKLLKTFSPSVVTGLKETDNGRKVVNCIGDSFTQNGTWYNEINNLCDNLAFVGMRVGYNAAEGVKGEGRSGWRLSSYFEPHADVTPTHMQPFSPFMHVSGYTYYGVIDFWKVIVNDTSQYPMGTEGFYDYKSWFDTNGYKVNPSTNDLMYDGVNDKYVYYNGSAWVDFNGTPTFEFNYAKYLSTWQIESPDFVMILLGTNDFSGTGEYSDANWAIWKERMDTLIASVHAYATNAGKTITIGICTPTVRYGGENSNFGGNVDLWSIGTFSGRKRIIDTYDNAETESDNVFVVDTGTAVDTEYGWMEYNTAVNEKPFAKYEGDFKEFYGYNGIHPGNAGYKQIGVVAAGFIQAKR